MVHSLGGGFSHDGIVPMKNAMVGIYGKKKYFMKSRERQRYTEKHRTQGTERLIVHIRSRIHTPPTYTPTHPHTEEGGGGRLGRRERKG